MAVHPTDPATSGCLPQPGDDRTNGDTHSSLVITAMLVSELGKLMHEIARIAREHHSEGKEFSADDAFQVIARRVKALNNERAGVPELPPYVDCLTELEQVKRERDEADRRAGAAERRMAEMHKSTLARNDWLSQAKREAGYSENVSFDVVWAETLAKAKSQAGKASQDRGAS